MDRLQSIYDSTVTSGVPLPPDLTELYGILSFPLHPGRPYVISNFVSTIDGVVSLDAPGKPVGDAISGSNQHDSMVMGLLRAVADLVVVGAGTLRASPRHIWTPQHVFPPYADAYRTVRARLEKPPAPLNVIVSAHGNVDLSLPLFHTGEVSVLIVTTRTGAQRFASTALPPSVQVIEGSGTDIITARDILKALAVVSPKCETILIEGGPHLIGHFFAEHCLDELFLTLSPQVAGRDSSGERLGLIADKIFAPEDPVWGTLVSVKRGGSHLFLRYAFASTGVT